jgi:hypothetical protein
MARDAAMNEYLKIAQDLDMYGVNVSSSMYKNISTEYTCQFSTLKSATRKELNCTWVLTLLD